MPTHITTETTAYVDLTDTGETTSHSHPAGSPPDASVVTYTPADTSKWDGSADPGDVNDALDQLASRVKVVEGAGGGPAFAVGSVFIGVVSTNPATLLGYGTWSAIGAGRVLVGLDSGDTDFDTVEETGGAKTKAISAHAGSAVGTSGAGGSHNHSITTPTGTDATAEASHTHTYTQVPNHVHVQSLPTSQTGSQNSGTRDTSTTGSGADALSTANPTGGVATGTTAVGASHNHSHSHTITTPTGNESAHTHAAGTVTQPNAHSDLNVVQPYFVVYMWKRTA